VRHYVLIQELAKDCRCSLFEVRLKMCVKVGGFIEVRDLYRNLVRIR